MDRKLEILSGISNLISDKVKRSQSYVDVDAPDNCRLFVCYDIGSNEF